MESKLILPPPMTYGSSLNIITLLIVYVKYEENLFIDWWIVFLPTFIYLISIFISSIYGMG